jgi:hypothetical protein
LARTIGRVAGRTRATGRVLGRVVGRVAGRVTGATGRGLGATGGPSVAGDSWAQPAAAIDNIPPTANTTQRFMATSTRFIE